MPRYEFGCLCTRPLGRVKESSIELDRGSANRTAK